MEKVNGKFTYTLFDSADELPDPLAKLYRQANDAIATAYAPYSKFYVGAAVLMQNGHVVIGSNQENAAYPSGICAERVAVFSASSQYPGVGIEAIAIAVKGPVTVAPGPVSPCGDCRQAMAEYEHRQQKGIKLLMPGGGDKVVMVDDIGTLLPFMFSPDHLNIDGIA